MNIQTDFNVVWSAWDGDSDPDENRVQGHGMTERAAINDLVEKLIERERESDGARTVARDYGCDSPGGIILGMCKCDQCVAARASHSSFNTTERKD